jgi:hypothetical protein
MGKARLKQARKDNETGMTGSFVPLGTQAGLSAEDRSPDLRLLQPPSQNRAQKASHPVVSVGHSARSGKTLAEILPRSPNTTGA